MRIIAEHRYDNNTRSFMAGEMTVLQYEKFIADPENTIIEILTEFQKEAPEMDEYEMKSFLEWLTPWAKNKMKTVGGETQVNDFHISKGIFLHNFPQNWDQFEKIPMREFLLLLEDLPIILGHKEYDPQRKSERIDGEALMQMKEEIK